MKGVSNFSENLQEAKLQLLRKLTSVYLHVFIQAFSCFYLYQQ